MSIILMKNTPQHIKEIVKKAKNRFTPQLHSGLFSQQDQIQQKLNQFREILKYIQVFDDKLLMPSWLPQSYSFRIQVYNLAHIQFTSLQILELNNQHITSLQALAWLHTPHLESLFTIDNYITCLKSFSKCNFGGLKYLRYEENRTFKNQLTYITRMNLNSNFRLLSISGQDMYFFLPNKKSWLSPAVKLPVTCLKMKEKNRNNYRLKDILEIPLQIINKNHF